ncbi:MAG TPA: helicase-related protein [Anaerolineae bacterium]|nr:helicase-related protein [Anaerolineae bacterium]
MSEHVWPEEFWPHQRSGCDQVVGAIDSGVRRIVLTSPTGMGKSRMMVALIEHATSEFKDSILYTHRRLLFDQTSRVLAAHGVEHGLRAAGHKPALLRSVQLAMTPSEVSAVYRRKRRELHPASLVLSDEMHAQGGDTLPTIHEDHYKAGAAIVGVTATPLDLVGEWDVLITAGTTADGRACGALVPAYTYCPDFPELKHIKKYRVGEDLTDKQNRQVMMRPGVFGRVLKHYRLINHDMRPTILFAPDVAGSVWFAEQFAKENIRAAHIDAKQIWLDGEYLESSDENRECILNMFRNGDIDILCNRFVLREGIDLPMVGHCIFACVFGSLKTYLQAGGRAIRAHPSLDHVTCQDHGGNFIRHGSLNESRSWELGQSGYKTTGIRQEGMRDNQELEPIVCPKCNMCRLSGPTCPKCGYTYRKRSRLVVQINGDLKLVEGASFRKHRRASKPDTEKKWISMYHAAKSKRWDGTFNQAEAYFFHKNHYYPPRNLPFMPVEPGDWFERCSEVPRERLQ